VLIDPAASMSVGSIVDDAGAVAPHAVASDAAATIRPSARIERIERSE
jgi:hypothetical protein